MAPHLTAQAILPLGSIHRKNIMEVIAIKLTNGEELIARCVNAVEYSSGHTATLTIEMPRVIGLQETAQGMGLGFMPYTLANPDATMTITNAHFIAVYPPKPEIEKAYLSQTSKIKLMG